MKTKTMFYPHRRSTWGKNGREKNYMMKSFRTLRKNSKGEPRGRRAIFINIYLLKKTRYNFCIFSVYENYKFFFVCLFVCTRMEICNFSKKNKNREREKKLNTMWQKYKKFWHQRTWPITWSCQKIFLTYGTKKK